MGARAGAEAALAACMEMYEEAKNGRLPGSLKQWEYLSNHADDDQWVFQMAWLSGRVPIHLDFRCDLFANMGSDCHLLENNPDYDPRGGKLRSTSHDTFPLVIHFSGRRPGRTEWQARLGTLRGPARPGCPPAGAEADPYRPAPPDSPACGQPGGHLNPP